MRIASTTDDDTGLDCLLCLSTFHADCIFLPESRHRPPSSLPQHVPCGLHRSRGNSAHRSDPLPQHVPCGLHLSSAFAAALCHCLCLSTFHADCIFSCSPATPWARSLPQHVPCGLHLAAALLICHLHLLCLSTFHADCIEVNTNLTTDAKGFASARSMRIASSVSIMPMMRFSFASARSMRIASANMHKNIRFLCKTCCELVDSFSDTQKFVSALAIFPYPSAAKATYVAICGSLGRTIDRFCGANCT